MQASLAAAEDGSFESQKMDNLLASLGATGYAMDLTSASGERPVSQ
jgi:hypothetical protein